MSIWSNYRSSLSDDKSRELIDELVKRAGVDPEPWDVETTLEEMPRLRGFVDADSETAAKEIDLIDSAVSYFADLYLPSDNHPMAPLASSPGLKAMWAARAQESADGIEGREVAVDVPGDEVKSIPFSPEAREILSRAAEVTWDIHTYLSPGHRLNEIEHYLDARISSVTKGLNNLVETGIWDLNTVNEIITILERIAPYLKKEGYWPCCAAHELLWECYQLGFREPNQEQVLKLLEASKKAESDRLSSEEVSEGVASVKTAVTFADPSKGLPAILHRLVERRYLVGETKAGGIFAPRKHIPLYDLITEIVPSSNLISADPHVEEDLLGWDFKEAFELFIIADGEFHNAPSFYQQVSEVLKFGGYLIAAPQNADLKETLRFISEAGLQVVEILRDDAGGAPTLVAGKGPSPLWPTLAALQIGETMGWNIRKLEETSTGSFVGARAQFFMGSDIEVNLIVQPDGSMLASLNFGLPGLVTQETFDAMVVAPLREALPDLKGISLFSKDDGLFAWEEDQRPLFDQTAVDALPKKGTSFGAQLVESGQVKVTDEWLKGYLRSLGERLPEITSRVMGIRPDLSLSYFGKIQTDVTKLANGEAIPLDDLNHMMQGFDLFQEFFGDSEQQYIRYAIEPLGQIFEMAEKMRGTEKLPAKSTHHPIDFSRIYDEALDAYGNFLSSPKEGMPARPDIDDALNRVIALTETGRDFRDLTLAETAELAQHLGVLSENGLHFSSTARTVFEEAHRGLKAVIHGRSAGSGATESEITPRELDQYQLGSAFRSGMSPVPAQPREAAQKERNETGGPGESNPLVSDDVRQTLRGAIPHLEQFLDMAYGKGDNPVPFDKAHQVLGDVKQVVELGLCLPLGRAEDSAGILESIAEAFPHGDVQQYLKRAGMALRIAGSSDLDQVGDASEQAVAEVAEPAAEKIGGDLHREFPTDEVPRPSGVGLSPTRGNVNVDIRFNKDDDTAHDMFLPDAGPEQNLLTHGALAVVAVPEVDLGNREAESFPTLFNIVGAEEPSAVSDVGFKIIGAHGEDHGPKTIDYGPETVGLSEVADLQAFRVAGPTTVFGRSPVSFALKIVR